MTPSSLNLKFTQYENFVPVTIVQVAGDLDSLTHEEFHKRMLQEVAAGAQHILLDFRPLDYISSAGLRALYALAKAVAAKGGQSTGSGGQAGAFKSPYLKLLSPTPNVSAALEIMGLNMSLEIYADEDTALASFTNLARTREDTDTHDENKPIYLSEEIKESLRTIGEDADRQRLELLSGKRFLIVMGSYLGKLHMYERARQLGVKMVVLDGPGHWTRDRVQDGLFEQFIEVDLSPTDTVAERSYEAIKATGLHFDGVATFEDNAGPLAALLANALHLPGHPLLSVGFSKNKIFTREICVEAGIPSPRFFRIKSATDLETAAAHVGFPAVLKPISGCSSVATYLVTGMDMLQKRYHQTLSEAEGHLKTSGIHSDDESELIWARGFDMTLEEFLNGEEFDVDVLLSEGEPVYASVTRDVMDMRLANQSPLQSGGVSTTPPPHLKEAGSQMPPAFPSDKQEEMIAFAKQVLRALEFTNGAFHVEMKYTSLGPRLIEVNARIGGGPIYYFHQHVWQVDLVAQYFLTCLGVPIRPQKASQPHTCLLTSDLPSPHSGTITSEDFLQPIASHPNVIHCKTKVKVGQTVIGSDRGVPDWLGEIMVHGTSVEEASQIMDELLSQIKFPIQAD